MEISTGYRSMDFGNDMKTYNADFMENCARWQSNSTMLRDITNSVTFSPCKTKRFGSILRPDDPYPLKYGSSEHVQISARHQPILDKENSSILNKKSQGSNTELVDYGLIDQYRGVKRVRFQAGCDMSIMTQERQKPMAWQLPSHHRKLLESDGQVKISAYMNFGLLTVHIIQGRQLNSKWKSLCDAYVKMSIIPDDNKRTRCKTDAVNDSNNPVFDQKFSFEISEEDYNKRLLISLWHKDHASSLNEFLGCMSFGVKNLINPKKEVASWFYLLTDEVGRRKHLKVSTRQKCQLKPRGPSHIPIINKDVWGLEPITVRLKRGKNGYGFSVVDSCPVRVGRVDGTSPAEDAGLKVKDCIIRVNGQNVSRSTSISVAKLVKHSSSKLILEIQRQKEVSIQNLEKSPWKKPASSTTVDANLSDCYFSEDESHENELSMDDDVKLLPTNMFPTSTPMPGRRLGFPRSNDSLKQDAVHRLMNLELDFIDFMHHGMQRYSRPLRHCILSQNQHTSLFQNIEKLVMISEYHIKQMQDNAPSCSEDTDTTQSSDGNNFISSIGLIYCSKAHMLCQAYDIYGKGLSCGNQVLADLRNNEDFLRFIRDSSPQGREPSISAFIYRPVQHIKELYAVLNDIFANTTSKGHDYLNLRKLVDWLQECINNINDYSCIRTNSASSLSSQSSSTGSLQSQSSQGSSSSSGSSTSGKLKGPASYFLKSAASECRKA